MEVHHPAIQLAATEAERWACRAFKCDRYRSTLMLCGYSGTGKTHILRSLYAWSRLMSVAMTQRGGGAWESGPRSHYERWPEAADSLRAGKTGFVEDCMNSDFLYLDDVGAEKDRFKEAADKLCQVLSRREARFNVISTNIHPEKWSEQFDFRISDRFFRNSVIIDFTGVDSFALR